MVIVNPMFCTFVLKNELRKKKASENPPRGLRSEGSVSFIIKIICLLCFITYLF